MFLKSTYGWPAGRIKGSTFVRPKKSKKKCGQNVMENTQTTNRSRSIRFINRWLKSKRSDDAVSNEIPFKNSSMESEMIGRASVSVLGLAIDWIRHGESSITTASEPALGPVAGRPFDSNAFCQQNINQPLRHLNWPAGSFSSARSFQTQEVRLFHLNSNNMLHFMGQIFFTVVFVVVARKPENSGRVDSNEMMTAF